MKDTKMRINVNLGEVINSNAYKGQNGNETSESRWTKDTTVTLPYQLPTLPEGLCTGARLKEVAT